MPDTMRDTGGSAFWHEAYFMRGGVEAIDDDRVQAIGFLKFAPVKPARGPMFSARERAGRSGAPATAAPVGEHDIYSKGYRGFQILVARGFQPRGRGPERATAVSRSL